MPFIDSRDQSSSVLAIIGGLTILAAILIAVAIFGGFLDAPVGESGQSTPTATSAQTTTFVPTPTASTSMSAPSPSPTATLTPTTTPTPWPRVTITPTPTPVPEKNYTIFGASFFNQLQRKPVVPIRARGWRISDRTFFMMVNLTADSEDSLRRIREQNGILTAYAQTLLFYNQGKLSGDAPTGIRVLEVNNTEESPKTFIANNSVVQKWSSDQIDTVEFHSRVYSTSRNQTASEKAIVRNIDQGAKNFTLHNGTATPTDE